MTHTPADQGTTTPTPAELREQIEHTRHELGVQDLADESDGKARAQRRAGELKETALLKAGELKAHAVKAGSQLQEKLPDSVKNKARTAAAGAGRVWEDKAPEPLRQKTNQYAQQARDNRSTLLVAASGITLLWLVRRSRKS
ncbi:DUF3618 domain-containing protein [Streptomyces sp. NPDC005385]|uniref:DUF3618 domain-containing protein n=1 Tax=Streptomyces sp. NPDC005385 TaxID=3157039 RepID=UPI0033A14F4B